MNAITRNVRNAATGRARGARIAALGRPGPGAARRRREAGGREAAAGLAGSGR